MSMHPKERLSAALKHQETDYAPRMMSASTWVAQDLKAHYGVETDRDLLKAMQIDLCDVRGIDYKGAVGPEYIGPKSLGIPDDWCGDIMVMFDYWEVITESSYGKVYSMGEPPLAKYTSIKEIEANYSWPSVDWFDFANVRQDLQPWTDEFAVALTGCSVYQHATLYRGVNEFMLDMAMNPAMTNYILDKMTGFYYDYARAFLEEAGDMVDVLRLADDIGAQERLLFSPEMLSSYFGQRIKQFADLAHEFDVKLLFHTDGNVRQAIPDLITWGIDVLDPVQPEVPDMDQAELKAEFGDRLCFSGGISAQEVLPNGTVEEVKAETKRVLDVLGAGGGYILSPGHPSLQGDIPIENIIAMYDAGLAHG